MCTLTEQYYFSYEAFFKLFYAYLQFHVGRMIIKLYISNPSQQEQKLVII